MTGFSRLLLKGALAEVRAHFPDIDPRGASIVRCSGSKTRPQYCFELRWKAFRYTTFVRADDAYEARAKGWGDFLRAHKVAP